MKIFHMSDIHLGRRPVGGVGDFSNKRYNDYFLAFENLCEKAIEMKSDVVIIAGDFFDRKELFPEVLSRAELILKKLVEKNIKVVLIEGNHDNITAGKESESWLVYLVEKGYIERPTYGFDGEDYFFEPLIIDDIHFYGLGYPGALAEETLEGLNKFLTGKEDNKNIVIIHTAISNSDILPGTVSKESIDVLKDKVIYIAGGHFHSLYTYPAKDPFFFIPGCPEFWDLAETGKRGAIFFDTDTGDFQTVESSPRKIISLKLNIKSLCEDDFREEFLEFIDNLHIEDGEDIISLRILPEKSFYFDSTWCEETLISRGALKVLVKTIYPEDRENEVVNDASLPVDTIEKEIIEGWKYFSRDSSKSVHMLDRLKEFQRDGNKDSFNEMMDHLLDDILMTEANNDNS